MASLGCTLRLMALTICATEVVVLLWYFIPLLYGVPYEQWVENPASVNASLWDSNFVPDLLFHDIIYRNVITCLIGLNLFVCAVFVVRLNSALMDGPSFCVACVLFAELFCIVASWIGWNVLTASYQDSGGGMTTAHLAGTAVFVSGNSCYFLVMLVNIWSYSGRVNWDCSERVVFWALLVMCFGVSLGFGLYFAYGVLTRVHVFGWIWEHLAFVSFVSAHIIFYLFCYLLSKKEEEGEEKRIYLKSDLGAVRITRVYIGV